MSMFVAIAVVIFSFFSYFSIGRTVGRTVVGCKNQRQHKIYVCIIYKTKSKANQNSLTTRCKTQFLFLHSNQDIVPQDYECIVVYLFNTVFFSSLSYFSNAYCSIHHSPWNVWKNFIFGLLMSMVMVLTTIILFYIYTDRVIEIYVMPNLYPVACDVSNHYAVCQVQRSNSWPCAAFMRIQRKESPVSIVIY